MFVFNHQFGPTADLGSIQRVGTFGKVVFVLLVSSCAPEGSSLDDDGALDGDESTLEPVEGPDFPIRYHTEYLDIAPGFTAPVCQGTLNELDRHMGMVATHLEIDVMSRPVFFWFNGNAEGALAETFDACGDWCSSSCDCTVASGRAIYGSFNTVFHELVHATVTPAWGRSVILYSEGVAHGFDGEPVPRPIELPSEVAGGTRHGGAHFTRWLVDVYGPTKFQQLFPSLGPSSTAEEVFVATEEVYGIPFAQLESEYLATSPEVYHAPGICDGLAHIPWGDSEEFNFETIADCSAPYTFGPRDEDGLVEISFTIDIPLRRAYRSEVSPDEIGWLTPCIDGPIEVDDSNPSVTATWPFSNALGGEISVGRYRLTFPANDGERIRLRIYPIDG